MDLNDIAFPEMIRVSETVFLAGIRDVEASLPHA